MSGEGEGKVVCVTGASGYVASWLVKLLLHRGYTVKATVRNLNDPKRTEHLKALEGAAERLQLFEADLLEEGSFDSVVHGCVGVFHTASPVIVVTTNPQEDLIDPAVKGTLNVLRSCTRTESVRRVVLTSSTAAIVYNGKPLGPDVIVDETWFSDPAWCEENKEWYCLSKTLAEEAAWKFAKESGIDLVVMNPAFVLGPLLQPTLNTTSQFVLNILKELIDPAVKGTLNVLRSCVKAKSVRRVVLTSSAAAAVYNGKPICPDVVIDETWFSDPAFCEEHKDWYSLSKTLAEEAACKFAQENGIDLVVMNPGLVLGPLLQPTLNITSQFVLDMVNGKVNLLRYLVVDVRDVGYAHILGFEKPWASGRYLLVAKTLTPSYLRHLLHKLLPSTVDALNSETENPISDVASRKKAESLGVNFMDVEVSFKDTIESLMEKNVLDAI